MVLGIDPGLTGALVLTDGLKMQNWRMPTRPAGKDREVDPIGIFSLLEIFKKTRRMDRFHIYLERAIPYAMGSKGAFTYGRGFAALEIAIECLHLPVTYVEPQKWTKEMHQGISSDLKPKAKSLVAVKRLYPRLISVIPANKNGALDEGVVDALLIAGYGLKRFKSERVEEEDFY